MDMPLGRAVVDVEGTDLTGSDRLRLVHPQVGGVILFSRNFASVRQLRELCADIRALRSPALPIAVDHEGGRVQRFREGFTALPAMRALGRLFDSRGPQALDTARDCGFVLATELTSCGVTLSFTPVLDVDHGRSTVIGERAFHSDPELIAALAGALIAGLAEGGLASVGKHFPGHGHVRADSHHDVPVDDREFAAIMAADMLPYRRLVKDGLDAVMPAHVIYPRVDSRPAGFSPEWLGRILRRELGFDGMIFSDDLSMEAAGVAGGPAARAQAALDAGCDMVLVCNEPTAADEVLEHLASRATTPVQASRAARLTRKAPFADRAALSREPRYLRAQEALRTAGLIA